MKDSEHYLQDACEIYAVALLQRNAQNLGIALSNDAEAKESAFWAYLAERGMGKEHVVAEPGSTYITNLKTHIPTFVQGLARMWPNSRVDFIDVESKFRNMKMRGDFLIKGAPIGDLAVSLKNYRNGARRPQVCSGTFNSFVLNFLFSSNGVGSFQVAAGGPTFRGSNVTERDAAIHTIGMKDILPALHRLDALNREIRSKFIDGAEFEFFAEDAFKESCGLIGHEGASLAKAVLDKLPQTMIKKRFLTMTGFDGEDEILLIDPDTCTDTITNETFRNLRRTLQEEDTIVQVVRRGQGIGIEFIRSNVSLLTAHVPFTINKNGAWISGEFYDGVRLHRKEGVALSYGQRRPKKSRELATSVNTYLHLQPTGIFD